MGECCPQRDEVIGISVGNAQGLSKEVGADPEGVEGDPSEVDKFSE